MERKKRYTRTYKEAYYVLTPAGFLHEYASSDPAVADKPLFSLFLPMCTLGPPSSPSGKSHKFHIEGRKDGTGSVKTGSFRTFAGSITGRGGKNGGSGGHAWAFRGRSHDDMMEWWNDIRMLCARYLVASEQMERSGPVAAAVRAAGYQSDDDGGEDEDDEGSSVEEENDEEDDEVYEQARDDVGHTDGETEPPEYEQHHGLVGGYLDDKKTHSHDFAGSNGAGVVRKPSKRQQEKAPEGQPPHVENVANGHDLARDEGGATDDDEQDEHGRSRFRERL